jgi:3-oxoacyl-[acyl-carrier protein] reductase
LAIVVTGAGRGVGRATALVLGSRGESLALLARPSDELVATADDALRLGAARVEVVHVDLTDPAQIASAAAQVEKSLGPPTAVVHNAGVVHRVALEDTTDALWEEQLAVNLRAPFQLTRALLPAMKAAKKGRFVFVGSISSTLGSANAAAYCAAKWGIVGLMKSLAEALSDTNLMACAILPGSIDTEMLVGSGFSPRMSADEVARSIAYFAIDAPRSHNGGVVEMFGT